MFRSRRLRVGARATALGTVFVLSVVLAALSVPVASPTSPAALAGPLGSSVAAPAGSVASPAGSPSARSAPLATAELSAPGQDPTAVSLSWTDVTSGTFYNYTLEEASAASAWTLGVIAVFPSDATTSTVVTGLAPATDYDWQVVENYETCTLEIFCSQETATSNLLNLTQPTAAFLNDTKVTSTGATLEWTNNATYGGLLAFASYDLYAVEGTEAPELVQALTSASQQNFSVTLTPGDSYSFYLNTSDCRAACGTGDPTLVASTSNVLTLGALESLTVSVFADRTTIDLGQSDLFSCSAVGGESPYSYAWNYSGGSTFALGAASESVELGATGTATVACQVTDSEPTKVPALTHVLVDPPLSVVASVNRTTLDAGQGVAFDCSVANGTSPYSITWAFGGGLPNSTAIGSRSDPEAVYGAAGDYAPSCTVSDSAGAETSPAFSLLVSPALGATAAASSLAAAPLTSLTFSASAENGSGTYESYRWTFTGTNTPAAGSTVQHAFADTGSDIAQISVVDSNHATAIGSVTVVVSDIAISVTSAPTSATVGASVTFQATASGGAGGPYNFSWAFGDGAVGYGENTTHAFASAGADAPTLTVRDRLGASNATALPSIAVSVAPGAMNWLSGAIVLLLAMLVGLVLAVIVFARRRSDESKTLATASSAYVPPTDPKRTIRGSKVCEFCGAPNLPLRTTCSHCGKPLPRRPGT